jgi:superoxide dismutase, Fe-Mn family
MNEFFSRPIRFMALALAMLVLLIACQTTPQSQSPTTVTPTVTPSVAVVASPNGELSAYPAQLPPLPYGYGALAKAIDEQTIRVHHDNHHATYIKNLNSALQQQSNLQNRSVEALLRDLDSLPETIRTTVQNNAGGHLNHTIFWQLMSPNGGGQPTGAIAQAITQTFGSFDRLKQQFNEAGGDRFGSGWVWLVRNPQGQLQIVTTPNQDNPITAGSYPVMGNDVWEHAYYLKYQNRRAEYLTNWWNVVNWSEVNRRFQLAS